MRKIAVATSAESFSSENYDKLVDELMNNDKIKPMIYADTELVALMSKKILFYIIILLLAAEWFLRKYWGTL